MIIIYPTVSLAAIHKPMLVHVQNRGNQQTPYKRVEVIVPSGSLWIWSAACTAQCTWYNGVCECRYFVAFWGFCEFFFPFHFVIFFFFHFPLHVCLIAYGWLLPISSIIWLNQREQLESVYCKDRKRSWPNGKYKLIPCARQLYHICLHRFGECCAVGDFWLNNMWKCLYLNALVLSLATSHANASRRLHFQ